MDADDYTIWVNVGLVLKPYGENGYKIWTEWASKSEKFDAAAQRRKWERDIDRPHSITYRSIFRMAIDNGWTGSEPPTTAEEPKAEKIEKGEHPLSLTKAEPHSGAGRVKDYEYIFDDYMSIGVNVIAGAPGVGKTTLIVPLALAVAHICTPDFALKPKIRRNVIIITESVVQVQRVIYSLYTWGYTGLSAKVFDERIKIISAHQS